MFPVNSSLKLGLSWLDKPVGCIEPGELDEATQVKKSINSLIADNLDLFPEYAAISQDRDSKVRAILQLAISDHCTYLELARLEMIVEYSGSLYAKNADTYAKLAFISQVVDFLSKNKSLSQISLYTNLLELFLIV